jgi:CO/xanthine dehydrogenase Mo-binding subunit
MSILGTRVVRTEDPRLLTAGGSYTDDLRLPELDGAVRATFVRSRGRPGLAGGSGRTDRGGSRRHPAGE